MAGSLMDVFVKIGADTSGLESGIGKAKGLASGLASGVTGAIGAGVKLVGGAIAGATTAVSAFATSVVSVGKNFDSSMSQVAATMGVTTDEIGELRDFAMDMGAKTAFSATQAADALNYMALAGYDADTSMKMLPNVLNLAAAGDMELARASDMVTDAQTALGLSLSETTELVDMMAKTSSKSNTSVAQLGDAILTVGGTAKSLAGGTNELNMMLGVLADNGIKGAEGGTHLRNAILSLSAPTDNAAKTLNELGIVTKDAEGNMLELPVIMSQFSEALDGLGTAERADIISTIFNKTDIAAMNALIDTSSERYRELSVEITDKAKEFITNEGYDPVYGARPLKRYIQKYVETEAAKLILGGDIGEGDVIVIDYADGALKAFRK
jgi:TP901 family phage tail tape measure protein